MNSSSKTEIQVPIGRWEVFLRALAGYASAADDDRLTVRCWKFSTFSRMIKAVIQSNQSVLKATFPSARVVIEHLKRMGWVHAVEIESPPEAGKVEFLLLDPEAVQGASIDPLELLQAFLPDGVISYFSAISYYELTTQVAAHHHVARLTPAQPQKHWKPAPPEEVEIETVAVERNPLGTGIFRFDEVGYYLNRRDESLVPGIQVRVLHPRCWLRITTLEQTLLDGLMQPVRCGGEAVVLEAWETGVKQIDADRMGEHLGKIQRDDLDRRVGAMLELLGAQFPSSVLGVRVRSLRERLATLDAPDIPLLAGLEFSESNRAWRVKTP